MRLRCVVCEHQQDAEHLAVACESCGARQTMRPVTGVGVKPGEPIVGPSKVPITREPLSQIRGADQEPLEVTRERIERVRAWQAAGMPATRAKAMALAEVPVQCGRCGGEDPGCVTCLGRATAPTEALREAAARPRRKPQARRRSI